MGSRLIEPVQLGDCLWRLGCYHMAMYLLRGPEGAALFEAGASATTPLVLAQLGGLGLNLDDITDIVVTHGHADHIGGLPGLMAALPKARIVASVQAIKPFERPSTLERLAADDKWTSWEIVRREEVDSTGAVPLTSGIDISRVGHAAPGDELLLAGHRVQVMSGGGHAPGGLVFWLPTIGAAVCADSAGFVTSGGPAFPMFFVSYRQYQQELAALDGLGPDILCPGHQQHWLGRDARWFLQTSSVRLAEDAKLIRQRHRDGISREKLVQWLFDRYYHGELTLYTPENIRYCCQLIVKRSLQQQ